MALGGRVRSGKFFRKTLVSVKDIDQINAMLDDMRAEQIRIHRQVIGLTFYMRGLTRDEAWNLTFEEREEYINFINKQQR